MRLDALQTAMMAAIDHGPDFIPADAFAGSHAAALRGLRIHANTISHARLIALEETFPRTLADMGQERFNLLSRRYLGWPGASAEPLATVGRHFPALLAQEAGHAAAALAAFEWAWLESYHAPEAEALALADLAGLDETTLLALTLARHPAARLTAPVAGAALAKEVPGLAGAGAILLTRPQADVLVAPATAAMARLFGLIDRPQAICNLLDCGNEPEGEDSLQALFALLAAGALILAAAGEHHADTV